MMSQTDKAYTVLKTRIVNLELPPGAVLREEDLMAELSLGRTPIREALIRLARDDLVVIQARRGMYVADIAITDLKHVFEARLPLEQRCARLAAERMTSEQLSQLEKAVALARDQQGPGFAARLMESDRLIHSIISESTGNKFLIDGVRWLYDLTARVWRLTTNVDAGAQSMQDDHERLLEALRRRDAEEAESIMERHILDFWQLVRSQV